MGDVKVRFIFVTGLLDEVRRRFVLKHVLTFLPTEEMYIKFTAPGPIITKAGTVHNFEFGFIVHNSYIDYYVVRDEVDFQVMTYGCIDQASDSLCTAREMSDSEFQGEFLPAALLNAGFTEFPSEED